jgi:hypothetical protein
MNKKLKGATQGLLTIESLLTPKVLFINSLPGEFWSV